MKKSLLTGVILLLGLAGLAQEKMPFTYPYPVQKAKLPSGPEVAYVEVGQGPTTLVFIHGLGSYLAAWQPNLDSLQKDFRCLALDLPGYGQSSKQDYPYSMAFFAQAVRELMEAKSISKAVLVGHSMGGQIALTLALQAPEKVEKIILLAPAGLETFTEAQAQLMQNFTSPEQIEGSSDAKIQENLEKNFFEMPEAAQFMIKDRQSQRYAADFKAYTRAVSASVKAMLEGPVFDKLGQIQAPTLLIFGQEDALIPNKFFNPQLSTEKVGRMGQEKIPNARLEMIPQAGHFVNFEKATAVNALIRGFLR
ncbi:MAG: alpha/beta hydrolase [Microscillaceae bacterium]